THPDHRGYVVEQQQEEPERRRADEGRPERHEPRAPARGGPARRRPRARAGSQRQPERHQRGCERSPRRRQDPRERRQRRGDGQPNAKDGRGVEGSDAITPRPSPAGTAVLKLRNRPARAASPAYSATMIWTTTNGQKVGLRSVFTADVSTPTAMPTVDPASA